MRRSHFTSDALNAGNNETQRIAVLGSQHLAVLAMGSRHFVRWTSSMGMVRVMDEPSTPSARMYLAFFQSTPQSSRISRSGTPVVNSGAGRMPWLYWTVGTAVAHSMPVLAPHSIEMHAGHGGSRRMSSTV